MQVSDTSQLATSATLGSKNSKGVGMVQDAAFMHMLSSTLYSNQKLAFVREILCNAWDSHIEAGITHLPIKVVISDTGELTIQDSGKGIHDDDMGPVYGVYGKSTKKNDSNTTGGFGLGSKSPWAYTTSFRVTSEHNGIKSVYNLPFSSVENDGMPDIVLIVGGIPTTRSGLTVHVDLLLEDISEIEMYIKAITKHGEMLVDYTNDHTGATQTRLPTLGMSFEPGSYYINDNKEWYYRYMGNHSIYIRYGSVIYPALENEATEKALQVIKRFMNIVGYNRIVVQAAPDSLALTPSREAFTSQKMTEDGITDVCVNLVDKIESDIKSKIPEQIELLLNKIAKHDYGDTLGVRAFSWDYIADYAVRNYIKSSLGEKIRKKYRNILRKAELTARKQYIKKILPRDIAGAFVYYDLKVLCKGISQFTASRKLAQKFIIKPLGKVMCNNNIPAKSIRMLNGHYYSSKVIHSNFTSELDSFSLIRDVLKNKVVFITTLMRDINRSVNAYHRYMNESRSDCTFIIHVSTKAGEAERVTKAFNDAGYVAINLTLNHDWDVRAQDNIQAKAVATAKKATLSIGDTSAKTKSRNALVSLCNLYDIKGKISTIDQLKSNIGVNHTTDTPLFFFEDKQCFRSGRLGLYTYYSMLSPDECKHGIIVRNGTERKMAIKRGAVPGNDYFKDRFEKVVLSKEYKEYHTKFRQKSISDQYAITSSEIKLLTLLKIKLPGYAKLTYNQIFEDHRSLLNLISIDNDESELAKAKYLRLDKLPLIAKLIAVNEDPMVRALGGAEEIIGYINRYPDRTSAIKSIITSAIKTGTKK